MNTDRTLLVTPYFDNRTQKPVREGPFEVFNKSNPAVRLWRRWFGAELGWSAAYLDPMSADLCTAPAVLQPDAILWRGVWKE